MGFEPEVIVKLIGGFKRREVRIHMWGIVAG